MSGDPPHDPPTDDSPEAEDYLLAKIDPDEEQQITTARRETQHSGMALPPEHYTPIELVEEPSTFALKDLLILTAFTAVLLAMFRVLPTALFASIAGVAAFLGLIVLTRWNTRNTIVHIGWWVVLLIYLMTSVIAVMRV